MSDCGRKVEKVEKDGKIRKHRNGAISNRKKNGGGQLRRANRIQYGNCYCLDLLDPHCGVPSNRMSTM